MLVGCERSQQIHEWFYGERAEQVDICPRRSGPSVAGAVLTKCCLLEQDIDVEDGRVVVPWGASLSQISEALAVIARDVGAVVGSRLTDSPQYAHLWGTPELARRLRGTGAAAELAGHPRPRWRRHRRDWASSRTRPQPRSAAHARADRLDLDLVAEQTRRTSHSMLGLIRALQQVLPESAREHVYSGATVQDVTDTWFALVMRDGRARSPGATCGRSRSRCSRWPWRTATR